MDVKGLLDALIAFVIFLIVAIVFLIVMFFIIGFAAKLVFGGDVGAYGEVAVLATGLIVAGSMIGGGALFKFKE
ncbi:MAG: hypothetical protein FWF40_04465 [Methanomassiliicoccaceae archaeon]|jgi:hypothetical protein|nr:hypothetical protein [Methanomassiliicoccaceae archaeon]